MRVLKLIVLLALTAVISSCGGGAPKGDKQVEHITFAEFETKVSELKKDEWKFLGDKPVIIDFYATWCPPCKKIAPILAELAAEYDGKIEIYKVDTDVELELASAFDIQSIPTLLFIPMNGRPEVVKGALSKEEFIERINRMLPAE